MPRVAIATTGGHYYDRELGQLLYYHLGKIGCEREDRDCFVVSWKPPEAVPHDLKDPSSGFKEIIYRKNDGLDAGCYRDFIYHVRDCGEEYDYIIVCHDDIDFMTDKWHDDLVRFMEENPHYDFASLAGGSYIADHRYVDASKNPTYMKFPLTQLIIMRVTQKLFDRNPFVLLGGADVPTTGNDAMALSFMNICNTWGSDRVGWMGTVLDGGGRRFLGHVELYKRGKDKREILLSPLVGWPDPATTLKRLSTRRMIRHGWTKAWLENHNRDHWKDPDRCIEDPRALDSSRRYPSQLNSKQLFTLLIKESKNWAVPLAKVIKKGRWIGTLRMKKAKHHPFSIGYGEFDYMRSKIIEGGYTAGYDLATAFGVSALSMGLAMRQAGGRVLTMDSYIEEKIGRSELYGPKDRVSAERPMGLESCKKIVERFDLESVVHPQVGWSPEDVPRCVRAVFHDDKIDKLKEIDCVFIDAGHNSEQLIADIQAIERFLGERFILFFHDWAACWSKDVDEYFLTKWGGIPVAADGCPEIYVFEFETPAHRGKRLHEAKKRKRAKGAKRIAARGKRPALWSPVKRKFRPIDRIVQLQESRSQLSEVRVLVDRFKDSEESMVDCVRRTVKAARSGVDPSDLRRSVAESRGVSEETVLQVVLRLVRKGELAFDRRRRIVDVS